MVETMNAMQKATKKFLHMRKKLFLESWDIHMKLEEKWKKLTLYFLDIILITMRRFAQAVDASV